MTLPIALAYRNHSLYRLKTRYKLGRRYRVVAYEGILRRIRTKGEGKRLEVLRHQSDGRVLYRVEYGGKTYYPVYSPAWDEIVTFLRPEWISEEHHGKGES